MISVRLYDQPFAPAVAKVFEAASIGEWLLGRYGAVPNVTVQVFAGPPSVETEVTHDLMALVRGDAPEYVVLESPGDGYSAFQIFQIVVAVFSVASALLASKPSLPGNVNRTQASPNNSLTNRENQVRYLQRVEDIYGTVRAIPSLMMPTYNKYVDNTQYEYGYYCVGRGYYEIASVRDGETLLSSLSGSKASFYSPFTSPNSPDTPFLQIGSSIPDNVVTAVRSIEVDGITITAPNQVSARVDGVYDFFAETTGDRIVDSLSPPNDFTNIFEEGDVVTIVSDPFSFTSSGSASVDASTKTYTDLTGLNMFTGYGVGGTVKITGFANSGNNGTFKISAVPSPDSFTVVSGLQIDETANATFEIIYNYSGTREVLEVTPDAIVLDGNLWNISSANIEATLTKPSSGTTVSDWVNLVEPERTEVWVNIIAPQGMYKDDGSGRTNITVEFRIEIEQIDEFSVPTGLIEIVEGSLSGATPDQRAVTVEKVTSWVGPARVRLSRLTNFDYTFKGTIIDEIKWADLYGVTPVSKTEFGNKTTVHSVTRATARATAVRTRQLNCLASRRLPVFNGSSFSGAFDADGRIASGTVSATSRVVDILAAVSLDPKIGRRSLATDVDIAQVWEVQQRLDAWNEKCGQFNYTLDTDNLSYEETVNLIANAAFCIAYRQNGRIRFALDQAQLNSTAVFTHRNKAFRSETITRKFASDSEYDGVEFVYSDPDTEQSETILLPLDGTALNAKKFEIAGIRSFTQAWLRANREYYKILGQRVTIETSTTNDARALLPNSRVDIVDNTRFKSYDGEVVTQSGMALTLSRAVVFTSGQPHSLVLMKRDGSLQTVPVTPGGEPRQVVMTSLPAEAIVTQETPDGGIRTVFSFAADDARAAQAYLVQEIDLSDSSYPVVRAVNYSASYYQADYATIPDKETIIN